MRKSTPLQVVVLTTDNRDHWRKYHLPEPIFGPAIAALFEGFADFPNEVNVHVLSATQKPLPSPVRLAPNITYHSLLVPKFGWLRTGYQGCIRAVRARVRELKPDLVHGEGTERDCALEAVCSGRPSVLTLHGNMRAVARVLRAKPFSYHWIHSFLESWALRRADRVFCNSSYTENWVRPLNQNVVRMLNPVRASFYHSPAVPSARSFAGTHFLMVGLICAYKQPLEVLRALRSWRQRTGACFHCLWVGAVSGERDYIRAFLAELEAARQEGWADHRTEMPAQELCQAMDTRDVLIHIPREEAFGLVVAEAMLRGMTVVAGRTGGIVDFEDIYPAIRMVNPGAPEEWIAIWSQLADRPPVRVGREKWDGMRFHPREIAQRHLLAYDSMMDHAAAFR